MAMIVEEKMGMVAEEKMNQDFLHCTICKKIFKEPKMLPCLHSFCLHCLKQWLSNHKSQSLACPTCKGTVGLASNIVNDLPQNIFLVALIERSEEVKRLSSQYCHVNNCNICGSTGGSTFCLDCEVYFCTDCEGTHDRLTKSNDHPLIASKNLCEEKDVEKMVSLKAPYCGLHKQEKLRYYCTKCSQLACQRCLIALHQGHCDLQEVDQRASLVTETFNTLLENSKAQTKAISEKLRQTELSAKEAERKTTTVLLEIDSRYEEIIRKLESDKEKLKRKVQEIKNAKCAKLADIESKGSSCLKAMENAQQMIRTILEQGNSWDILKVQQNIEKSCETLQAHKDEVVKLPVAADYRPIFQSSRLKVFDEVKERKLKEYIGNDRLSKRQCLLRGDLNLWLEDENFIGKIKT